MVAERHCCSADANRTQAELAKPAKLVRPIKKICVCQFFFVPLQPNWKNVVLWKRLLYLITHVVQWL